MDRSFFIIGSILAGLAVLLGAFGAHGLKNLVTPELIETWEKAVRYQMYHALALLLLAWAITHWPEQVNLWSVGGWLFFRWHNTVFRQPISFGFERDKMAGCDHAPGWGCIWYWLALFADRCLAIGWMKALNN